MGFFRLSCVYALLCNALAAPPFQVPLQESEKARIDEGVQQHVEKKRPFHGRFLHITDFHPDRFYEIYSSTEQDDACHRGKGPASIYGAESSDCDSPVDLVNKTMEWIGKELKDKIDFVVWTGDSARHDNDEDHPRNEKQVVGLNEFMVQKMFEVFGKHNGDERDDDPNNDYIVPIIPTFGNNDILPHNIFRSGPNKWTRGYAQIWKQFIPEAQKHQFEQGGWFYVEVIPNKLAVFSLNTMYFFTSNAAADGCAAPSEPGYRQMEWLRIQLQYMRDRGMKVVLTGHVPPTREKSKTGWDETCWQKYTLWLRQYRDVIVTSIYGHFNYDHFILQDFEDLNKNTKKGKMSDHDTEATGDDEIRATSKSDYFVDLRNNWSKLPVPPKSLHRRDEEDLELDDLYDSEDSTTGLERTFAHTTKSKKKKRKKKEKKFFKKIGGRFAERYAASFVSASVVPNLYPTLRVFEYNMTGLDPNSENGVLPPSTLPGPVDAEMHEGLGVEKSKKKKKKKHRFEIPESPSKSSPPGPAYSPQTFSLLRYTQYFANLTRINNDFEAAASGKKTERGSMNTAGWNEGMHKGETPHDKGHTPDPREFRYEVHYDTHNDDVYELPDLTMLHVMDLARRIGLFKPEKKDFAALPAAENGNSQSLYGEADQKVDANKKKKKKRRKRNKVWYAFISRAYVETLTPEEMYDDFEE